MPSLVVRLTSPDQTIDISTSGEGLKHLYLVGYRGTGMAAGNPSLYLRIEPQSQLTNYGNLGNRFPIYFSSNDDRNGWMGALGIPITGDQGFNASRLLRFKISLEDGSSPQFTSLELHFLCRDTPCLKNESVFRQEDFIVFAR